MNKEKFTKTFIEKIEFPTRGQKLYWDTEINGFGVVVGQKTKSFVAQRDIKGRTTRVKIGKFPNIHPETARKLAIGLVNQMANGVDPRDAGRNKAVEIRKLEPLAQDYFAERGARLAEGTLVGYRNFLTIQFSDWLKKDLKSITREMVIARYTEITNSSGKTAANNAMQFLRALYNFAAVDDETLMNPVEILSKKKLWHPKRRRQDVISVHEMRDWYKAVLQLQSDSFRDAFILLLLTGLRKNEAFQARWENVDFRNRTLHIPQTKNGKPLTIPLCDQLVALLQTRRGAYKDDEWIFPGRGGVGHIVDPKKAISRVQEASTIKFSMHTLRRTFITIAESLDISPYAIKALVNHSSGNDVTSGYIVQTTDRLRDPSQKIADEMCRLLADPAD